MPPTILICLITPTAIRFSMAALAAAKAIMYFRRF